MTKRVTTRSNARCTAALAHSETQKRTGHTGRRRVIMLVMVTSSNTETIGGAAGPRAPAKFQTRNLPDRRGRGVRNFRYATRLFIRVTPNVE